MFNNEAIELSIGQNNLLFEITRVEEDTGKKCWD
jgi:hypothetical protein